MLEQCDAGFFVTFGCFLYHWQTLIGAGIALGAAALALGYEWATNRATRYKKGLAARSQLPTSLSDLSQFTRDTMRLLDGRSDMAPVKPVQSIQAIQSSIEFMNKSVALKFFELVSFYQVHNARLAGWQDETQPRRARSRAQCIYDCAKLQALINQLFDYARNEADRVSAQQPSKEEIYSALRTASDLVYFLAHQEIYEGALKKIDPEGSLNRE